MPRQLPNRTHGHPLPPKIYYKGDAASAMHGGLIHVSMGYTPVKDRFHTRYSPVRRSPSAYCYAMLPLDLHVLSLSLAFILSHPEPGSNSSWYEFHLFFFLSRRPAARLRDCPDAPRLLLVFLTFQYLKELFLLRLLPRPFFRGESGCKDKHFLPSLPNFPATFFKVFSKTPLRHAEKTGTPSSIPLQAVHVLMPLPKAGAKVLLTAISSKFFRHFFPRKLIQPQLNTVIQFPITAPGNTAKTTAGGGIRGMARPKQGTPRMPCR